MLLDEGPIFYLTDGSQPSLATLPSAAAIADSFGLPLHVVHLTRKAEKPHIQELRADAVHAALPAGAPLPPVTVAPLAEFTRSEQARSGVVALVASHRRGISRFLDGDNYQPFLRSGVQPVLALPKDMQAVQVRRVLFPVDFSPRSQAAYRATIALCRTLGAELHLLHVFCEDRLLSGEQDQAARDATQSPAELLQLDKARLRQVADEAEAAGVTAITKTAEGNAHTEIIKHAAAQTIDLIVMATHGPRSIADILLGSTTTRVIQSASVPVLAVRSNTVRLQERVVGAEES